MKNSTFFIYLLILAGTTYLIRVIPFIAIKEKINNRFIRSFLYYIPYAVLTAMTIPAIFYATNWWVGAVAGLLVAVLFALKGKGLTTVAIASCVAVFLKAVIISKLIRIGSFLLVINLFAQSDKLNVLEDFG